MKRIILAALVGVLVSGPVWGANALCERLEGHAFKVFYRIKLLDVQPTEYATDKYDPLFNALSNVLSSMDNANCGLDYIRKTTNCLQKVAKAASGYDFSTKPTSAKRPKNPKKYMESKGALCQLRGPTAPP